MLEMRLPEKAVDRSDFPKFPYANNGKRDGGLKACRCQSRNNFITKLWADEEDILGGCQDGDYAENH